MASVKVKEAQKVLNIYGDIIEKIVKERENSGDPLANEILYLKMRSTIVEMNNHYKNDMPKVKKTMKTMKAMKDKKAMKVMKTTK